MPEEDYLSQLVSDNQKHNKPGNKQNQKGNIISEEVIMKTNTKIRKRYNT